MRDTLTFRAAVMLSGRARQLKAGEYRFDRPMSAVAVVEKLARGDVYKRLITFREGLTIAEMAAVFEERGFGAARDFAAAARNAALIHDLDPDARDARGVSLSRHLRAAARHARRGAGGADGGGVHARVRRAAARGRGRRTA